MLERLFSFCCTVGHTELFFAPLALNHSVPNNTKRETLKDDNKETGKSTRLRRIYYQCVQNVYKYVGASLL